LLDQARERGAEVREGQQVMRLLRSPQGRVVGLVAKASDGVEREVYGAAVVGADGAGSIVARQLGRSSVDAQHLCLAARTYVQDLRLPDPYLEIFTTARTLPGCAWAVPVQSDVANVGIGVIRSDAIKRAVTPQQLFQEVISEVPLLAERLRGKTLGALRGWSLPGASQRRQIHGPGCLLVGDAGAMIDVFTGHGIHTALKAGAIAGEVLADAIAQEDLSEAALSSYATRCSAAFLEEAAAGWRLQRLHRSAFLMSGVARVCGSFPPLRRLFLSLLGHAQPRHALLSLPNLVRTLGMPSRARSEGAVPSLPSGPVDV
jgi:flavin-dependent dehydrogenase